MLAKNAARTSKAGSSSISPAESPDVANLSTRPSSRPRNRIAVRKFGTTSRSSSATCQHELQSLSSTTDQELEVTHVLLPKRLLIDMCCKFLCSSCGKRSVQMKTEKLSGRAFKFIMYCTSCGIVLSQVTRSGLDEDCHQELPEEEIDYDVNWRFVKFFVSEGKTYDDVVLFSKTLGIPVISKGMFSKYRVKFLSAGK